MSPQVSRFIDVARWIAALAVLITHVDANALVVLADIPHDARGPVAYLVWFFYGFAHQAVVVFFVLSGFLVGGGVSKAAQNSKRYLSGYLIDRTTRIYVVLIPVLVATAVLDALGRHLFADTGVYATDIFTGRSGALVFLANLANLQDIFAPYFGTDSALWTLAHEYWYYVTFGLLIMPLSKGYGAKARWAGFAAGVALLAIMSGSLSYHLFGFALWLSGVAAARLARPLVRSRSGALVLFLVFSIGLRLFVRYSLVEIWWVGGIVDAIVALLFANLLLTLRFDLGPVWRWCEAPIHRRLSDFSYSLYALHMPLVVFLCAGAQHTLGMGWRSVPMGAAHWLLALAILSIAVGASYAFSLITEAQTPKTRRAVRALLEGETPRGQVAGAVAKG